MKIVLDDKEQLFASRSGSELYSIAELSDGERNALLICADVLSAECNQLILIDEPERHLHQSIISPLLTALFNKRKDCIFVVSTHDMYLPIDNPDSSIVLVRDCEWENSNIKHWEADLISKGVEIPDEIKYSIIGSKRKVLFVEGEPSSLDQQFYQLIYPELSVVAKGNCKDVIDAVKGVRGVDDLTWIESYGLIDADDRTDDQIQKLLKEGVAATNAYSVESLYYRTEIIMKVANRYAQMTDKSANTLYELAVSKIIEDFIANKNNFCARLCEKRIRDYMMSKLPTYKDVLKTSSDKVEDNEIFSIDMNLNNFYAKEKVIADELIHNKDLNGVISRYPIRESQIIANIVKGIGINRETYESIVRKLIIDNVEVKDFYRYLLRPLTNMLN